jgi:hypothetical protein
MSEPFTKRGVADMADAAAREIENLRAQIATLTPKAHAYDNLSIVLRLMPQQSQGYGEDMAWKLRKRAEELRQPEASVASVDDGA